MTHSRLDGGRSDIQGRNHPLRYGGRRRRRHPEAATSRKLSRHVSCSDHCRPFRLVKIRETPPMMKLTRSVLVAAVALWTAGCMKPVAEQSRWDQAQRDSTGSPVANGPAETAAPSDPEVSDTPPEWNPN